MFTDGKSFMCMELFLVRREHLWTQVLQKTWFSQILSFCKEAHFAVKKSSSQEGYTLSNTSMMMSMFHRCSLMVNVLCVWYCSWTGGNIFEPRFCKETQFSQILSFRKEANIMVKKSLPLERVIPYPTLVWWSLCSIDVPWWYKFYVYGTILGQEGASLNPGFAKKHDFHKFTVFIKRHILQSKKVFLSRGLYLIQYLYGEA